MGIISKNTILKAIHNSKSTIVPFEVLGIISKNTILKAIHNKWWNSDTGCKIGNYK